MSSGEIQLVLMQPAEVEIILARSPYQSAFFGSLEMLFDHLKL